MAGKNFVIFFLFIITWTCLIETTLSAAGWCYECNSNNPYCQLPIDAVAMQYNRAPCNGQCYTRIIDGVLYRGCSWEHGFMSPQPTFTAIPDRGAIWYFCDTPLCNANVI